MLVAQHTWNDRNEKYSFSSTFIDWLCPLRGSKILSNEQNWKWFHFSYNSVISHKKIQSQKFQWQNRFSGKTDSVAPPFLIFTTSPSPLLALLHHVLHLNKTSSTPTKNCQIPMVNVWKQVFYKSSFKLSITSISASTSSTSPSCQFGQLWVDNLDIWNNCKNHDLDHEVIKWLIPVWLQWGLISGPEPNEIILIIKRAFPRSFFAKKFCSRNTFSSKFCTRKIFLQTFAPESCLQCFAPESYFLKCFAAESFCQKSVWLSCGFTFAAFVRVNRV